MTAPSSSHEITRLGIHWGEGEWDVSRRLALCVYSGLYRLTPLRCETTKRHNLQATALNEAYSGVRLQNRAYFFVSSATRTVDFECSRNDVKRDRQGSGRRVKVWLRRGLHEVEPA